MFIMYLPYEITKLKMDILLHNYIAVMNDILNIHIQITYLFVSRRLIEISTNVGGLIIVCLEL